MKRLTYLFVRGVTQLLAILPFTLVYLLSDLFFLIIYLLSYRKEVITRNLRSAFPHKSDRELRRIMVKFYRHLADLMLEGLKGLSMTPRQVLRRHRVTNPGILQPYYDRGVSVIGVTGHYGNWEWGALSGGIQVPHPLIALYKPLSNPYLDRFLKRQRTKFNCRLASIRETRLTFESTRHETVAYMMVADQSPTNLNECYWVEFLNQETACLHGPEKYFRLYGIPVFFVDIQRKKRGFYEMTLTLLAEDPATMEQGELTALFMKRLEGSILNKPEHWLWSHRRWKHKRDQAS